MINPDKSQKWLEEVIVPILNVNLRAIVAFAGEIDPEDRSQVRHYLGDRNDAFTDIGKFNGNLFMCIVRLWCKANQQPHPAQYSLCMERIQKECAEYLKLNDIARESLAIFRSDFMGGIKFARSTEHYTAIMHIGALPDEFIDAMYNPNRSLEI